MREIHQRTGMATISLGSGPDADVMFLFTSDICGEGEHIPRHARVYGDLPALHAKVHDARVAALAAYREDVQNSRFPAQAETADIDDSELAEFRRQL